MKTIVYQAIVTTVIPCTNTKPTRIKAKCQRGSLTQSIGGADENDHLAIVQALVARFADTAEGPGAFQRALAELREMKARARFPEAVTAQDERQCNKLAEQLEGWL